MEDQSLQRFEIAQSNTYEGALRELRLGKKRGHWMWFIFPQLRGLGQSPTSWYYGISCLGEAEDYIRHEVLGPRLIECTRTVLSHEHRAVIQIFPHPDDMKFASCMTLFSLIANAPAEFKRAIDGPLAGEIDTLTIELLGGK